MKIDTGDRRLLGLNAAGAVACGTVAILFFAVGLNPLLGRATAAATARRRLEAAVEQRDTSDAAIREGTVELRLLRQEMASTLVLRPASAMNELLARVSTVAAGCGVRLDDVHVGKLVAGDRYATLPLRAVGRGSYRDCVRFLHQLSRDCPDVGVAEFRLGAAGGEINVDLELRWHTAVPTVP